VLLKFIFFNLDYFFQKLIVFYQISHFYNDPEHNKANFNLGFFHVWQKIKLLFLLYLTKSLKFHHYQFRADFVKFKPIDWTWSVPTSGSVTSLSITPFEFLNGLLNPFSF